MPYIQPSRSDVHVDRPLTNISLAELQSADGFVADRAFPVVPVAKQTDKYFIYDTGAFTTDDMKQRAPSTESAGGTYEISSTSYSCDVWAVHRDVDDQVRANADSPLQLNREAAVWLSNKALLKKEILWSAAFMTTSIWTTDQTGVSASPTTNQFLQWNDDASDPVRQIRAGMRRVHGRTGTRPNKFICTRDVFDTLMDHPDIIDRINRGQTPGGPAIANKAALAQIFEVDEVLVMDAVYNTAAQGQTASLSYVTTKRALLLYTPRTPGLMTPSAGYTFTWSGLLGATALSSRITRLRMDAIKSDRFEIEMAFDQKKTGAAYGQYFTAAIA